MERTRLVQISRQNRGAGLLFGRLVLLDIINDLFVVFVVRCEIVVDVVFVFGVQTGSLLFEINLHPLNFFPGGRQSSRTGGIRKELLLMPEVIL